VCSRPAFTLIELLVVIAIIGLLVSILVPSLAAAKDLARGVKCAANLRALGSTMGVYLADNDGYFWPYARDGSYFWGRPGRPVDPTASPFMTACGHRLELLWCPSLPWGSYVPQAGVDEPTTTYGYNAWCLDPGLWGRRDDNGKLLPRKRASDLGRATELFVFADTGLYWAPAGVPIFQNSTSLDPVTLGAWGPNFTPTTHFRHQGRTNALCADGHAAPFGREGGRLLVPDRNLGFVGTENAPHYDIE